MAKRPDSATRARRLLALIPLLDSSATRSLTELAVAVGGTPEDVADDLLTLSMCGVPPFTPLDLIGIDIEGDQVTVFMEPPALDRPLRLTVREARALLAALDAAGYDASSPLRDKLLEAASAEVPAAEFERTLRAGAAPGGVAAIYATLAAACESHEKVRLVYLTGASGRVSTRVVHPWLLVDRRGTWYLVAFCEDAGEERVFRLDRIESAEPAGATFEPPVSPPPARVTPDPDALPVAEVVFAAGSSVPDAHEWPGSGAERRDDGSTLVRVPVQSTAWLSRQVARAFGAAEVVSPPEMRAAVREFAERALREVR